MNIIIIFYNYFVQIAQWAAEAYLKFGGEPHFIFPTTLGPGQISGGTSPPPYQSPIGTLHTPHPISTFPLSPVGNTLGRPLMGPEIKLSGKHDGMCLYLSRLLCQLWDVPVAMETEDNKVLVKY